MYAKNLSMEQWLEAFDTNPSDFHLGFDFEINDLAGFAYIEVAYLNIRNHEFALPYHEDFDLAEHIPMLEFLVKEFDDEVNNFNRKRMFAEASAISDKGEFYKDQLNKLKRSKTASSQASWSILAGGVSDARVEAYKLRIAIDQMVNALQDSPAIEEVYRLCGDTFLTIPDVLSKIERHLDKTNYALIQMGSDFYRQRLPHSDMETVDIASKYNPTPSASRYINSEETTKQAASSGVFWSDIADLVSDKLMRGEKEILLTRQDLTPNQFRTLLEYESYGLVKNFGSYVVLTEEAIQDLLEIAAD